jgi:hypothetical protein
MSNNATSGYTYEVWSGPECVLRTDHATHAICTQLSGGTNPGRHRPGGGKDAVTVPGKSPAYTDLYRFGYGTIDKWDRNQNTWRGFEGFPDIPTSAYNVTYVGKCQR